ncbi:vWA domain-containing protein [Sorangium sp. So ce1097]|uniref:vWA domain-containing protein n=1 Tax=Sorangium sp. So ce1097 TaxID=3133330 RepID=UPI003F621C18
MKLRIHGFVALGAAALLGASGCSMGADDASDVATPAAPGVPVPPGSVGVSQGGSQDFGLFRQILEDGEIPGPDTLDDVGFFAEHKLDYPAATCGEDVCMHGLLGIMGNMISGSPCTLVQIGMNSPVELGALERPPLHLVIAVDTSSSMEGDPITYVKAGLLEMIDALEPTDRISLVRYANMAEVVLERAEASDRDALTEAFEGLVARGSTNLYDGLFTAFAVAERHLDPAWQNRVIFLSDGVATVGLTSPERLRSLAAGYAEMGIGVTAVGVGGEFDVEAMRGISEVGAGNFYFLEDPKAVEEVFTEEVKTFVVPLALDVDLDVTLGDGYVVRGAYGTNGWRAGDGGGTVHIPSLFLAGRTSAAEPVGAGRRGGGGAILLELVPRQDQRGVDDPHAVGSLELTWKHPLTGEARSQKVDIEAPSTPDAPPEGGFFSDATVEKGFVMLNLFAGFKLAAQLAADADPRTARRTLEALRPNVEAWLEENEDPDVEDDLRYVDLFIQNLIEAEANVQPYTPADPPNPWPAD